jgi:translocation and assembly module TamA
MSKHKEGVAMKWLLALVLLASTPALLQAQEPPAAEAATAPASDAFQLDMDAPEEIRQLLAQHLDLLRYRELTDLSDSELSRLLSAAQQNTQDLVATLGYFAPDIQIKWLPAPHPTSPRVVSLHVVPGEPTRVREVTVDFIGEIANDPLPLSQRQEIADNWGLQPGQRFTQAGWDNAKQQALRELTTQRFPTGRISTSLADIDPVTHSARLSVTLDSGPAYRLGELVISGTQRYDPHMVTRLARLRPGQDYEQSALVEAQQRLGDSGYFDSAFVAIDTTGDPQAAPVQVQLREAMRQKLVLGIGASTDSGARLSAEHTHHKVPGIGWRAVSKFSIARDTSLLGSELTAPPDADNWRWAVSALVQKQPLGSFDVTSQRLRAGRSQSGEQIDRNYYLQYDRARTAAAEANAPDVTEALSANYAFTVRHFDSLPFPTRGWGLGVEVGGGTTLGSQQEPYSRLLLRGLGYLPLGARSNSALTERRASRLAVRAEVGAVLAKDGIALPSTQLFLSGGDTSVRGYSLHHLGVLQPDGQISPGRYLSTGSVEWQRPISRNGRLTEWESTVFIDAGAVADQPHELKAKVGVGVGARWRSPVGPLQIDLAYGLDMQRFRLHLNVGFSF